MLTFTLATGNAHKAQEFSQLFDPQWITVTAAPAKLDVLEDGESFTENALKKAEAYYQQLKVPVMSDDSGLIVEALPGELGIHTARFGGDDLTATERNELLLQRLEKVPAEQRDAHFVCVLCFYLNPNEIFFFEGILQGEISPSMAGAKGFGYDPVFSPHGLASGQTLAAMPDWKEKNSHRALACQSAQKFFQERNRQF